MNRAQEIDYFLKYYAQIYIQNPNVEITSDTIYHALETYEMRGDECKDPTIVDNFDKWQSNFKESRNLMVYHDVRQRRFLQFHNRRDYKDCKYVKVYLNFSKEDIYECVSKIFSFIDKHNIQSYSKVADKIRSDSVVLRLGSIEEARFVMDYINNDQEISKCARLTNPFVYRNGVCGVAYDALLSYNSVISKIIANYFAYCKNLNRLNDVSFNDFVSFVNYLHNNNFRDVNGIKNYAFSEEFRSNYKGNRNDEDVMLNLEQIYQTLIISLNEKTTVDNVIHHIENCRNEHNNSQMVAYYRDIVNSPYTNSSMMNKNDRLESKSTVNKLNKKDLFDQYIMYNISKYGSLITRNQVNNYIHGNTTAITRDNNFRKLITENLSPSDIIHITNGDLINYINIYSESIKGEKNDSEKEFDFSRARMLLEDYIRQCVFLGFTSDEIQNTLNRYINGDRTVISDNFQRAFFNYVPPEIVNKVVGNDLYKLIQKFSEANKVNNVTYN